MPKENLMKTFAWIFGAGFLIAGIAGFIPALCPDGKLFGLFAVDTVHNIVHIATGVVALALSMVSEAALRIFFRIFGIVYGLVAVLGLFSGDQPVLGIMANNMPDVILHFAASAFALYCGFARGPGMAPPSRGPDLREA
jgi:hypothetical protein